EMGAQRAHRRFVARGEDLRVAHTGAFQPLEDGSELYAIGIVGVDLPRVLHRRGHRQRLAAGSGAKVEDLATRRGTGEKRSDLARLVLDLEPAFAVARLGLDIGRAARSSGRRNADANWGDGRWLGAEARERLQHALTISFQSIHPEINRCPTRQGPALFGEAIAEHPLERWRQP